MKLFAMLSAGLIAASAVLPAAASAQMGDRHDRVATRTVVRTERHRGYHRPRTRQVCTMRYRDHRRVRVCRTVRY